MIHPDQKNALMAFVVAELLPHGVVDADVNWANQDQPGGDKPWVILRSVSAVADGFPDAVRQEEKSPPDPLNPAGLYIAKHGEAVWEIQTGYIQGDAPDPLLDAGYLMGLLETGLYDDQATFAMRETGLAPKRIDNIIDISAIARGSQWETRASMTVVFSYAQIKVDTTTSTIVTADVTGTVSPVSGTVGGDTIGP